MPRSRRCWTATPEDWTCTSTPACDVRVSNPKSKVQSPVVVWPYSPLHSVATFQRWRYTKVWLDGWNRLETPSLFTKFYRNPCYTGTVQPRSNAWKSYSLYQQDVWLRRLHTRSFYAINEVVTSGNGISTFPKLLPVMSGSGIQKCWYERLNSPSGDRFDKLLRLWSSSYVSISMFILSMLRRHFDNIVLTILSSWSIIRGIVTVKMNRMANKWELDLLFSSQ